MLKRAYLSSRVELVCLAQATPIYEVSGCRTEKRLLPFALGLVAGMLSLT